MWPLKLTILMEKWSPFLRVSTHISSAILNEIDGKMFILRVYLGMCPLKSIIVSEKQATVLRVSTYIYGVSKEIDGKTFSFQSKLRHVTPQIDHLRKPSPVLRVSTDIYSVSKEIDGETFILRVNLGMWPLKSIMAWKNKLCSESSNTHLCSFQANRWENIHFYCKPRHVTPQINCLRKPSPVLMVSTHIYGCFQGDRWENIHF